MTGSFNKETLTFKHTFCYLDALITEKMENLPYTVHVQQFPIIFNKKLECEMFVSSPVVTHDDFKTITKSIYLPEKYVLN